MPEWHPVLGDRQYGLRADVGKRLPRHMLHASALRFTDPQSGHDVRVTSPLPKDFKRCLRELGLR